MPTLAERQLAAWEAIAEDWPVSESDRVYRCGDCAGGVALATDMGGVRYLYTHEQYLALVVLHLRNHHADLDPDKEPGGTV